jgi:hypothetical protein
VDSQLRAFFADGEWITNASQPVDGQALIWDTTTFEPPPPVYGYTAIAEPDQKYPELAWNGQINLWSLCPSRYSAVVFYDQSAANCYSVRLNMVKICEYPCHPTSYMTDWSYRAWLRARGQPSSSQDNAYEHYAACISCIIWS